MLGDVGWLRSLRGSGPQEPLVAIVGRAILSLSSTSEDRPQSWIQASVCVAQPQWPDSAGTLVAPHRSQNVRYALNRAAVRMRSNLKRGRCMLDSQAADPACWSWPLPTGIPSAGDATALRFLQDWQASRCALCGIHGQPLVCDHDHESGLVRGYLCRSCNVAEGQVGENADGKIGRYQRRSPAVLLNLTIIYVDPWTGRAAEPRLTGFEPWKDSRPGHCRRCYTEPAASCDCPLVFRLDPKRIMFSIVAVYAVTGRLRIKDARRTHDEYIGQAGLAAEDIFVRDMLLNPGDATRFLARWMGGRTASDNWAVGADSEHVLAAQRAALRLPASANPIAVHPLAPPEAGQLIAALAQVIRCACDNDFPPLAIAASELIMSLGIALASLDHGSVVATAQQLANTSALLDRTAELLSSEQWRAPADLDSLIDDLADALRRHATAARQLQTKPPRPECTFCGETEPEAGTLLFGGDGCICEGCARRVLVLLDDRAKSSTNDEASDAKGRLL